MALALITRRRPAWERLTALLDRAQRGGLSRLSAAELEELGRLYRAATSDLAIAHRDYPGDPVVPYLNQLVGRAHAQVYQSEPLEWRRVGRFFTTTFPRAFRAAWPYTLAAFAMFLAGALLATLAMLIAPDQTARALLPPELIATVRSGRLWINIPSEVGSVAAASIMTNNIQVAFYAFAGGALLGLGTLFVLVNNGISIGAVLTFTSLNGLGLPLLSFIMPHGIIELTVIFVAGGAGLRLGKALLAPGLLGRREALIEAARRAVLLILGCAPLLVVAGTLEGFVSPSPLPNTLKISLGLVVGALLYVYLLLAGRRASRAEAGLTNPPLSDSLSLSAHRPSR